jgi:hypothetical protein
MSQVGNGTFAKRAFGALDEESVLLQYREDSPKMAQMISP